MDVNMKCPNCDREVSPDEPLAVRHPDYVHSNPNLGHGEGCLLRAVLGVIQEREDHDLTGLRLEAININDFWDEANPLADWLERSLGLIHQPVETVTITRVAQARCDDCGQVWPIGSLKEPKDLHERVDEDGPTPSGECPDCGALAYPVTKADQV